MPGVGVTVQDLVEPAEPPMRRPRGGHRRQGLTERPLHAIEVPGVCQHVGEGDARAFVSPVQSDRFAEMLNGLRVLFVEPICGRQNSMRFGRVGRSLNGGHQGANCGGHVSVPQCSRTLPERIGSDRGIDDERISSDGGAEPGIRGSERAALDEHCLTRRLLEAGVSECARGPAGLAVEGVGLGEGMRPHRHSDREGDGDEPKPAERRRLPMSGAPAAGAEREVRSFRFRLGAIDGHAAPPASLSGDRAVRYATIYDWTALSTATPATIAITPASWILESRSWNRKNAPTAERPANCEASTALTAIP